MKTRNKYLLLISGIIILALISVSIYFKFFYEARFPIYKLVRVVDGNTFIVNVDGKDERVRLLYVDTPESVHPDPEKNTDRGRLISQLVKEQVPLGKKIVLEKEEGRDDRDRHGRLLRYMFLPSRITHGKTEYLNFNIFLVKIGYSPYYTKYGRSKKYDKEFKEAEEYAKKTKLQNLIRRGLIEEPVE